MTRIFFIRLIRVIRGLLEVLRNTNDPNDTNLCFIRLIRVIRGLLEVLKNTNVPNDTKIYFIRLIRVIRVRFIKSGFGVCLLNFKEHELFK